MRDSLRALLVRLRALVRRGSMDRDLEEELEQHLERETRQNVARGMSERDARISAARDLGNTLAHREAAWEAFGWTWLDQLIQDVRQSVRVLLRNRGYTAVTILILGLGIGASATMFSAIHGVLLRPLPYRSPDRLVALWESDREGRSARSGMSAGTFAFLAARTRTLDEVAAYRPWGFDLTGTDLPERVRGARVSGNLFSLLGVRARVGRTLLAGDDVSGGGGPKVVLLSEELWQRRFGAEARVLGSAVTLNGEPYTVVGVLPRGFTQPEADLWVPLALAPYELEQHGDRPLTVIGRLTPGLAVDAARREMQGLGRALEREYPVSNAGWGVTVLSLRDDLTGAARTPLVLLFAAALGVLLVACANVANLLLARSAVQRREIALCAALGASRMRITRRLATEIALIGTAAGALGLWIAAVGSILLARAGVEWLPRGAEIRFEPIVLAFGVAISLVTVLGLSMVPARNAARVDASASTRGGSLGPARPRTGVPWRDAPVVAQIAVAMFLLVGGGLLLRSFLEAQAVPLGFTSRQVLSMTISLSGSRDPGPERVGAFFEELREGAASLPGIRSAALVSHPPLSGAQLSSDFIVDAPRPAGSVERPAAHLVSVTPGYFETLGIPVRAGRAFGREDRAGRGLVVVIDETLARRFWPGGDAVGRRIRLGTTLGADSSWREVVGVVGGVRASRPERDPEPTIYVPHAQGPWPTMSLVARTSGEPERVREATLALVRDLGPQQPVYNVRSLDEVVARALAARRMQTLLMVGAALVAFLLAVIGVYGMMSYAMSQHVREIGVRMALGATRGDIVRRYVGEGVKRIGVGVLAGAVAAFAAGGFLRSLLYGLEPWDPVTFAGALLLVVSVGLLACYVPAARAARSDPLTALRLD